MKTNNRNQEPEKRLFLLGVFLILGAFMVLGQVAIKVRAGEHDDAFYRYVDVFTEAYSEITNKYVEDVDEERLFEGALQGMFLTLDSHSQFLDPDSLSQLEKDTEGEFSGIGIHITLKDGVLTVIAPIPGSPSAKLGIRSWDRIIEINGESTEGISLIEAVKKLTGPPGTQVSITIYRKGESEPLYFTITRATIKINSVYFDRIGDDIGYIRLAKFSDETGEDLKKAILSLKKEDVRGLILDLRFNTGGLLNEVVKISEYFVPKGEIIVSTKGRVANQNRVYKSEQDPIVDTPLVVLINRGSASASEILTGAVQDHRLGVIIGPKGERTFGKGSVQTIEELKNTLKWDKDNNPMKCAIRLTTARYYTPSGKCIDKIGIKPDIEIDVPEGNQIELARRGLLGDPDMNEPAISTPSDDNSTLNEDLDTSPALNSFQNQFFVKKDQEKKPEQFVDYQLEESVKIMKAYLLMTNTNNR
ncbi:S41 family peptidase [Candidatus Sumerlaeota bacterium]|nr:S41 family peptidase [Candidatus Sumerlaeota bacterium]